MQPIAVGCTVRRLVAMAACSAVQDRVTERLAPLPLGFGVRQGAEAAVGLHAARCYIRNIGPGEAVLKIDFASSFNAINRDEVFSTTADYAPELLSFLCYDEYILKSEVGVQQGDPLGPMSYCTSTPKMIYRASTQTTSSGALGGLLSLSARKVLRSVF
jgi:hypothetical protein